MEVNVKSIADKILHAPTPLPPPPAANNDVLEKKMDQIKNDMESMVGKVLQALAGLNAAAGLGPPTKSFCILVIIFKVLILLILFLL